MESSQKRFYEIMDCYLDDERVAAHAIVFYGFSLVQPEIIYRDLLSCEYGSWVDALEQIADTTRWDVLMEYCLSKQFELDMLCSGIWSCGDVAFIEKAAWKLTFKGEEDGEDI